MDLRRIEAVANVLTASFDKSEASLKKDLEFLEECLELDERGEDQGGRPEKEKGRESGGSEERPAGEK